MTVVMVLVVLLGEPAPRSENPPLVRAWAAYQELEPKACLRQLEQAAQRDNTPAQRVEIEILGGLCAFFVGDESGAAERFGRALGLSPDAELPPHTSPKIDELFQRVRRERLKAADGPTTTELTPRTLPAAQGPEFVAAPPAGRPSLAGPITLLSAAVVATAVGIVFGVMAKSSEGQATPQTYGTDRALWEAQARNARLYAGAANVSYAVAGVAAVSAGAWLWWSLAGRLSVGPGSP